MAAASAAAVAEDLRSDLGAVRLDEDGDHPPLPAARDDRA